MRINEQQLDRRVRKWQKRLMPLGVAHFEIVYVEISDEIQGHANRQAEVSVERHYDNCGFEFKREFLDECSPSDLDQAIVHEWLHVAMRDHDNALEEVENWMPEKAYDAWHTHVLHEREGFVDRVATLIAKSGTIDVHA